MRSLSLEDRPDPKSGRAGSSNNVRLQSAKSTLAADGIVLISRYLSTSTCLSLLQEAKSLALTPGAPNIGRVNQRLLSLRLPILEAPIGMANVGQAIRKDFFDSIGHVGDIAWPNEVDVVEYPPEGYISPHFDHACYRYLIAICTIYGEADFRIVKDRRGQDILQHFVVGAGDTVLMTAPGISARLMHSVANLTQERLSIMFRFNSSLGPRPRGELSAPYPEL